MVKRHRAGGALSEAKLVDVTLLDVTSTSDDKTCFGVTHPPPFIFQNFLFEVIFLCVKPNAVLVHKSPSDKNWTVDFFPDVTKDEVSSKVYALEHNYFHRGDLFKTHIIPCKQCFECRMQASRVWANRCVIESEQYPDQGSVVYNWFVTLTYDNDHVSDLWNRDGTVIGLHDPNYDRRQLIACNELLGSETLEIPRKQRDHLQTFNDSVRAHYSLDGYKGIRFFACGEYGDKNMRPHYHIILFNCPIDTKNKNLCYEFGKNAFGHTYYRIPFLEKIWKKGYVICAPASWESMAYTARYITKKQNGENGQRLYDDNGIISPFVRSSRKPGIGAAGYSGINTYFSDFVEDQPPYVIDTETGEFILSEYVADWKLSDKVYFKQAQHGEAFFKAPSYYDSLLERDYPLLLDRVKEIRQANADRAYDAKKSVCSMSDRELFETYERQQNNNPKGYRRDFILDFC